MGHLFLHYLSTAETYGYSMTFLPIFGNLRKMGASECGMISFMNEKITIPR